MGKKTENQKTREVTAPSGVQPFNKDEIANLIIMNERCESAREDVQHAENMRGVLFGTDTDFAEKMTLYLMGRLRLKEERRTNYMTYLLTQKGAERDARYNISLETGVVTKHEQPQGDPAK